MNFDDFDLSWLTEIVRSHQEAIKQLEAVPPHMRATMTAELARRQLVFGSEAFAEFVAMMHAQVQDLGLYRDQKDSLSPGALAVLETSLTARAVVLRDKLETFKRVFDSI